jgi:hypothetical protein
MTEQAISPLRRRMIEDMTIRKFAQKTNMTMCNGSRSSRATSRALPIQPDRKMYAAFSCI